MFTNNDLKLLVELLHPVRAKWYEIGLQLGLRSGDLDAINKDSPSDCSASCREMLKRWLAGVNPCPTRKALSDALQTDTVGECRLGLSSKSIMGITRILGGGVLAPKRCSPARIESSITYLNCDTQ